MYRDAVKAMAVLEEAAHAARLAGGCVRDRLLGLPPADYDIATDAPPDTVMRVFKSAGLRTVPTGIDHGTVTLVMPAGPVEITTLRTDLATDGRRAQVAFGSSFEQDAARRDFTINALFEDRAGTLYDFFGGRADLAAGILRFVGDAAARIHEDYLRILRFFRFQARFGYAPAPGTLEAIAASKDGLARISQERITSELLKTTCAPRAMTALRAMSGCGVLALVLPELAQRQLAPDSAYDSLRAAFGGMNPPPAAALAFFLLYGAGARPTASELGALARRLRLPTREAAKIAFVGDALERMPALALAGLADRLDFVDACEKAAGGPGAFEEFFAPLLMALGCDVEPVAQAELLHGHRRRAALPVDGRRLQAELGLVPGPELGRLLELLRREFRDGRWTSADEALARARQLAAT
jgi:tRNA nucleotidyltransferase/poly(A) polymerase